MGTHSSKEDVSDDVWLPSSPSSSASRNENDESDVAVAIADHDEEQLRRNDLQTRSIEYLADVIRARRNEVHKNDSTTVPVLEEEHNEEHNLAKGRFRDLTCTEEGELILEQMFHIDNDSDSDIDTDSASDNDSIDIDNSNDLKRNDPDYQTIIRGSIIALQSLLILGTQVGVKGSVEQQKYYVSHLSTPGGTNQNMDMETYWNQQTSRQLKHKVSTTAAMQLLATIKRKRSAQSAADLLVELGVWTKHEDLALLRSGFPVRFSSAEEDAAHDAEGSTHDPDRMLGLRRDLRELKAYTIDDELTTDIDDGISIETITKVDGSERKRIWIHIADADRWSPRNSDIFQAAQKRATSVYLPTGAVPMFPPHLCDDVMSLTANCDSYALSLSVELNDDGSIDVESLQITPSLINVNYRLSYNEVDEMFDHGLAYFEEWELGALLAEANKRRIFRIANGSTEGFVPKPIPQNEVRVVPEDAAEDQLDICIKVAVTHNAGFNQSSVVIDDRNPSKAEEHAAPLSSGFLLVTEMMILAGEAMGKLGDVLTMDDESNISKGGGTLLKTKLHLPYRTQAKADFAQRNQEFRNLEALKNDGDGYCHAWYARRFFNSVKITPDLQHHAGLGLDCYVQWTSPIRRFGDLQVHAAVKRCLRKKRLNALMQGGQAIPDSLVSSDLGCLVPVGVEDSKDAFGKYTEYLTNDSGDDEQEDKIDYKKGIGFIQAARNVQRKSKEYWIFEYLRRKKESEATEVAFEALVLGCVDPRRFQYAIYVHELGLEHRYLSEMGSLKIGETIWLKVASTSPRQGLLTFGLAKR